MEDDNAVQDECFVCRTGREEGPMIRACRCAVDVHERCIVRLVTEVPAHAEACPACGHAYDVEYHATSRPCPRRLPFAAARVGASHALACTLLVSTSFTGLLVVLIELRVPGRTVLLFLLSVTALLAVLMLNCAVLSPGRRIPDSPRRVVEVRPYASHSSPTPLT